MGDWVYAYQNTRLNPKKEGVQVVEIHEDEISGKWLPLDTPDDEIIALITEAYDHTTPDHFLVTITESTADGLVSRDRTNYYLDLIAAAHEEHEAALEEEARYGSYHDQVGATYQQQAGH